MRYTFLDYLKEDGELLYEGFYTKLPNWRKLLYMQVSLFILAFFYMNDMLNWFGIFTYIIVGVYLLQMGVIIYSFFKRKAQVNRKKK